MSAATQSRGDHTASSGRTPTRLTARRWSAQGHFRGRSLADQPGQRTAASALDSSDRELHRRISPTRSSSVLEPPAAKLAARSDGSAKSRTSSRNFTQFLTAEKALSVRRERAADAKTRHAIELGVAGLGGSTILILLFGIYLARGIARPVSEAAEGASKLAAGDLSIRLSQQGPRRGRRADQELQRDGRAPRGDARRAGGSERAAQGERAPEVGPREHRLARAPDATLGRDGLHEAPAHAGVRPRDQAPLPRHRRRAGAPAVGPARRLPRRPPDRGRPVRARQGARGHGDSPARGSAALQPAEPEARRRGRDRAARRSP